MDRTLLQKLITQKAKDYSYAIMFFLTFSFFVVFVIRPNLLKVFNSFAEIEELKKINNVYDSQIQTILLVQADLEQYRPDLTYINQALSQSPVVNKVLSDLNDSAAKNEVELSKVNVSDINLKDANKERKLKAIKVDLECAGTFEHLYGFIKETYNQRRLKLAKQLIISHPSNQVATDSSQLIMTVQIEGYYL